MKELKTLVREKYGQIAQQNDPSQSCCESACCGEVTLEYSDLSDDYNRLSGYVADADLNLGCGLPTEYAKIKPGSTVVDLGSGAGNDCFVARNETGDTGQVYGIDFTSEMIDLARKNAKKLGYENVHFRYGDIEEIPLDENFADVVVSNCVFNLVPDKEKAFKETYRILKPGGHFSISDIVVKGPIPKKFQEDAELYAGCVSGAIQQENYLDNIRKAGFEQITIQKSKTVTLPEELLDKHLSPEEKSTFLTENGIFSITVYGVKPQ